MEEHNGYAAVLYISNLYISWCSESIDGRFIAYRSALSGITWETLRSGTWYIKCRRNTTWQNHGTEYKKTRFRCASKSTKRWGNSFYNIISHFVHISCVHILCLQDCVRIMHKIRGNLFFAKNMLVSSSSKNTWKMAQHVILQNGGATPFVILSVILYTLLVCRIASA